MLPPHRAALRSARDDGTVVTNLMTGRPARGIVNRVMRELGPISAIAPEFPLAGGALAPLRAKAQAQGSGDFSSMWAGQAAALGRELPARELTLKLVAEAQALMKRMAGLGGVGIGSGLANSDRIPCTPIRSSPGSTPRVSRVAKHDRHERRTWFVVALTAAMMVAEIVGGTIFGSMAVVADGWHMSTHAGALAIAALAYRFARRHAHDPRFTFGTGKSGRTGGVLQRRDPRIDRGGDRLRGA